MGVGLGGEATQRGQQWGHLQPCPPLPSLPCHQHRAVGMLTSDSPAGGLAPQNWALLPGPRDLSHSSWELRPAPLQPGRIGVGK